ncbi:hypothetical protein Q4512_15375 [Oceanihabitans sp. 2_MG-2023]|uniref:hypothetical protein n=1 Tax=Oceanihabitans sp. 2_MG-2023 TaxID=3062661 RepID=UPI0026E4910C|nr:hypothetical protein [Oceanihabitans sp. 2_MG-2023]MDO6598304.1 hypothetical protein [Oceanihabitans sp. 2_MG-2023]
MQSKLITILFFVFVSHSLVAQYGWTDAEVFLKSGEVKTGQAFLPLQPYNAITISSNEMLKFRTDRKAKKEKYKPNQVDSVLFKVEDRVDKYTTMFISKKKKRLAFVQLIVEGNVAIVGRTEKTNMQTSIQNDENPWEQEGPSASNYFNHNRLFLVKEGEVLEKVKVKGFRVRAMEFFADCDALVKKLDSKKMHKDNFYEIAAFYNTNCN